MSLPEVCYLVIKDRQGVSSQLEDGTPLMSNIPNDPVETVLQTLKQKGWRPVDSDPVRLGDYRIKIVKDMPAK